MAIRPGLGQEQAEIIMYFLPGNVFLGNVFPGNVYFRETSCWEVTFWEIVFLTVDLKI